MRNHPHTQEKEQKRPDVAGRAVLFHAQLPAQLQVLHCIACAARCWCMQFSPFASPCLHHWHAQPLAAPPQLPPAEGAAKGGGLGVCSGGHRKLCAAQLCPSWLASRGTPRRLCTHSSVRCAERGDACGGGSSHNDSEPNCGAGTNSSRQKKLLTAHCSLLTVQTQDHSHTQLHPGRQSAGGQSRLWIQAR